MKSKDIAQIAIFAALYFTLGAALPLWSFGIVQCRVADALYPLITIYGWPGVIGLTLGGLMFNAYGFALNIALGPLDLLSPLIFLPFKIAIHKWGFKAVPLHVFAVGLWVPFLISLMFGDPMILTAPGIILGEAFAEIALGGLLLREIKRRTL